MALKRFGIILIDKRLKKTLVLSRINYALYNRINNNNIPYRGANIDLALSMYIGYHNILEFPKGVRDRRETPLMCALREFFEETGIYLDVSSDDVLEQIIYTYTSENNKTYTCTYFVIDISFSNIRNSTKIVNISNLPILSDNFNILICTDWYKIRNNFLKRHFHELVLKLDRIFA